MPSLHSSSNHSSSTITVFWLCFATFSTGCAFPLQAFAASPAKGDAIEAEILFNEANKLVEKGQCAAAIPKFEASERADHSNGTLYNLANALECAGRLASAWKMFMTVADAPTNGKPTSTQQDAEKRAALLEPRLPHLTVVVPKGLSNIAGLEVLVDDAALPQSLWNLPIPVDPGTRSITVKAPGKTTWSTQTREIKEKDAERVDVPIPPDSKQRVAAIVVGGVGVAVGIAAIITGGLAKSNESAAWKACTGNEEPTTCVKGSSPWFKGTNDAGEHSQTIMNRALSFRNASTALFIVSGAALGTAAVLWATTSTSPKKDAAFQFVPYAAPGNVGASAHFTF